MSTVGAGTWLNLPNAVTALRLLLVPVVGLTLLAGESDDRWRWVAWAVFVVAAATDRLDGWLARRRGEVTPFGVVADPIADKALVAVALLGLSALGEVPWWLTVVILGRELAVTLLRAAVLRRRLIPASAGGKLKTVLQLVALGGLLAPLPAALSAVFLVLLYAAAAVTVATGVAYVVAAVRAPARDAAEVARTPPAAR